MPSVDPLKRRKIVVMGSRSVGKSSLVKQFIENHFINAYHPTIETEFSKIVNYRGTDFECQIVDTAGQDEYTLINSKYVIGVHGYILVYSVTSRNSFDMVQNVYNKILDFGGKEEVPCVIVGAKTDLESSSPNRQIDQNEGEQLAKQNHAAWVETSAKDNLNIGQVFELCIAEIEKRSDRNLKPAKSPQDGGCCLM